jgi:hypothetical protein
MKMKVRRKWKGGGGKVEVERLEVERLEGGMKKENTRVKV